MATAQALREFKSAQAGIVTLAQRELFTFWNPLDKEDAVATSRALQLFVPQLVLEYGDMAATIAADFYDSLRADSKAKRTYRAVLSEAVDEEAAKANTRWAIGPLFGNSDPKQALDNLNLVTDKAVKASGRNTIETNVERDPSQARFARVPSGAQTCKFCLMLASRGAVYHSEKSAGDHYHGNCDCQPVPVWDESDLPEGYDPDALYEEFKKREREDSNK